MSNPDNSRIWHDTSIALIKFANKFKRTTDEEERLVGYLILDVGVETLLRSFLAKSNVKTKSDKMNFPDLIDEVRQVAGTNINEDDLEDAKRFHNFRNKIYHQEGGFFPGTEKFDAYLKLADKLLILLVDRKTQAEKAANHDDLDEILRTMEHNWILGSLREDFQEFKLAISVAAEAVNPKYTTRKIEEGLKELLRDEDIDTTDLEIEEKYNEQQNKLKEFQKLTGIATENITFIDDVIYDITYLYLLVLLKNKKIESDDFNKYLEYRELVEKFSNDPDKAATKDKEKLEQIRDWARALMLNLYALYDDQTPIHPQSL